MSVTRFRGDTKGFSVTIRDSKKNPIDITGCSLKISVSAIENPIDETEAAYVLELDGVITTPATDGKFEFTFTDGDVDFVGDYFYDAQFTDATGKIATLDKDIWTMSQDITK